MMAGNNADYLWAMEQPGMYIKQDTLKEWLESPGERAKTLLIDVRDDDYNGGHPATAINYPDSTFDAKTVASQIPPNITRIVLSCMESARRAPRCARQLHNEISNLNVNVDIHILKGGADKWLRRFVVEAPHLVQGFDNDFWGWPGDGSNGPVETSSNRPGNKLYTRPADQSATPWSGPGEDAGGSH